MNDTYGKDGSEKCREVLIGANLQDNSARVIRVSARSARSICAVSGSVTVGVATHARLLEQAPYPRHRIGSSDDTRRKLMSVPTVRARTHPEHLQPSRMLVRQGTQVHVRSCRSGIVATCVGDGRTVVRSNRGAGCCLGRLAA